MRMFNHDINYCHKFAKYDVQHTHWAEKVKKPRTQQRVLLMFGRQSAEDKKRKKRKGQTKHEFTNIICYGAGKRGTARR